MKKENKLMLTTIIALLATVVMLTVTLPDCSTNNNTTKQTTDSIVIKHTTDTILQTDTIWKERTIVKTHLVPTKITPIETAYKAAGEPKNTQTIKHSTDTLQTSAAQLAQQQAHYEWQGTDTTNKDITIDYHIEATGTDVTLDLLHLTAKYAEIHQQQQINNNIETYKTHTSTTTTTKQSRFNFTVGVGAGWGIINKKPDIYVGGTLGIRLF